MIYMLRFYLWLRRSRRTGLIGVTILVILAVLANAVCFYHLDHDNQPELTFGDALWYSVVSITTIGYGDFTARGLAARLTAVFFIIVLGLASFAMVVGIFADALSEFMRKGQRGLADIPFKGHVLIINDPGVARTLEVITSNLVKPTIYSAAVDDGAQVDYTALARSLLDQGITRLSVIRDDAAHTHFLGLSSRSGDRIVYLGNDRLEWHALRDLVSI